MPGSDGIVILDHIAKSEKNPKMIVSSGHVAYDNILEKYNIDMFIQKPFLLENEIVYIEEILGE
jgi:DNA-binding NtrC family response regulator